MQQTSNRGHGAARQEAVQAGCVAQGSARMGVRIPAAAVCLGWALLLAACGGGGGGDAAFASAVPLSGTSSTVNTASTGNAEPSGSGTGSGTTSGSTGGSSALPDGYAPDGTLPPPLSSGPRSQNARGMTRALIDEWNATCTDQPACQIDQAQIDAYNREVCDAYYPDDAGCYIGQ